MGNVVYIVDSGRGRRVDQSLDTPNFKSTNGRVWRMELDKHDPTKVTSLTVLVEGDDADVKTLTEVHQPDNIETTPNGFFLTEDPGSSQQFPADSTDPLRHDGTTLVRAARGSDGRPGRGEGGPIRGRRSDGCRPGRATPAGNWGAWESTGIVDASAAFGPGAFLINIQAHTLWIEQAPGDDNNGDGQPDFTFKREGGQLLLLRIPWA